MRLRVALLNEYSDQPVICREKPEEKRKERYEEKYEKKHEEKEIHYIRDSRAILESPISRIGDGKTHSISELPSTIEVPVETKKIFMLKLVEQFEAGCHKADDLTFILGLSIDDLIGCAIDLFDCEHNRNEGDCIECDRGSTKCVDNMITDLRTKYLAEFSGSDDTVGFKLFLNEIRIL